MAIIDKFTKEELEEIVKHCCSYRELAKQLGYVSIGNNGNTIKSRLTKYNISTEHFTGKSKGSTKRTEENVFCLNSTASQAVLRNWYLKGEYTEYRCAICGQLPFWNGKELSLTLDHINGNNKDNRLENLRWVCPNCDRQLPTFAGRNQSAKERYNSCEENVCENCGKVISKDANYCIECWAKARQIIARPSPEQLEQELIESNFSAVGRKYGVSDNTIRKWCKAYGMSTKASDYKK